MLQNKKILIGVCGSIAAYKTAFLIRLLKKQGAEVKVVMTASASEFITSLTLSTLSGNPVFIDFKKDDSGQWNNHVDLGLWADLMIIAPASANTLAKMAHGLCDNLLMAVYLSARCPIMVAPAMDLDMYAHPASKKNLETISAFGNIILDAEFGELASGLRGKGRMAEPESIFEEIKDFFVTKTKLQGKKVLITAGPTYEPLDPVRFIGNYSSGKMGYELAKQCHDLGADVTLISGPTNLNGTAKEINLVQVKTAAEMHKAVLLHADKADILILAAAVADYTPKYISESKIKKSDSSLSLELVKTVDIAAEVGKKKKSNQLIVGFALETDHEVENAMKKLESKNFDFIVLNSLKDAGAGFAHDTNKITIIEKGNKQRSFELKSKKEVAADIIHVINEKINA